MTKEETNGFLRATERQLQAVEDALQEIDRRGDLNDQAFEVLRTIKVDLINLTSKFSEVRGWNTLEAKS